MIAQKLRYLAVLRMAFDAKRHRRRKARALMLQVEMPEPAYEVAKDSGVLLIATKRKGFESLTRRAFAMQRCGRSMWDRPNTSQNLMIRDREGDWYECIIRFHRYGCRELQQFELGDTPWTVLLSDRFIEF